jgi:hypothetical protein
MDTETHPPMEATILAQTISGKGLEGQVSDSVNHPAHYTAYKGVEVIDLTEQMNFNKGNAVKYICRAGLKSPETELEDLNKARWYIDREIDRVLKEKSL